MQVLITKHTWNAPPTALLVKLPVLASMESGVIVLDPQHTGLPPGAIGIDLPSLLLMKPPLTLVSSSPTTWHLTLYLPLPVYLVKYLKHKKVFSLMKMNSVQYLPGVDAVILDEVSTRATVRKLHFHWRIIITICARHLHNGFDFGSNDRIIALTDICDH